MQDLTVAGLQTNIIWQDKEANFSEIGKLLQQIVEVDLVLLPEMFQTGFCFDEHLTEKMEDSPTLNWMREQSANHGFVLCGSIMMEENKRRYNRLLWVRPDGTYAYYDKRHLFSMTDEPKHFSAGSEKLVVDLKGWKICPMVCYDLRFPVWIRNVEAYDVLLFNANWPAKRSLQWQKLLQARAIENQCFVVGVNRVGDDGNKVYHDGRSAIINPLGEPLVEATHQPQVLKSTFQYHALQKVRRHMPFLSDRDEFSLS